MTEGERREFTRSKTRIAATVYEKGKKIPATIIDISMGGLGLLSKEVITPGSNIKIVLSHTDKYAIGGTVQWAMLTHKGDPADGQFQYRTGVRAHEVLDPKDILTNNSF